MTVSRGRENWWRPRGIAARIALLSLLVTAIAVTIIAIGVLGVAQATFDRLMLEAGQPAATARAMFDHSVVPVFIVAAGIAAAVTLLLGVRGQWRRVTVAGRFMGDPRWREPGGYRGGLVDAALR